ncbi:hypothetical protein TRFO_20110 [Tritrichomonas foetus]|uniref:Uncharacterized protein n=1 Tax=Tritrichomonas foetus TaxID=1144522 RepID=A0A1J4KLG3_9EUKA|nr:hypothetical protein TRFO_20110 [Tritrichomonas foetus]|eukprot:OHT10526.1 hypothetical protein TRFO_20110 [Tritrichomonas foetus]
MTFDIKNPKIMKKHQKGKDSKKQEVKPKRRSDDAALVKAAQMLLNDDIDLNVIPDCDMKEEFLELAELAIQDRIKSLQKARLEFLTNKMEELHEREKNHIEIEKRKQEQQILREKREKNRRLLRMKTKKGQPILKNLARIQYQQVREMIQREQNQKH